MQWGLAAIAGRVQQLAGEIRDGLELLPGVAVHDRGRQKCGIVSFTIGDIDPFEVKARMAAAGINITTSSAASTRIDMEDRNLALVNRLGVHYYNSEEELARLLHEAGRLATTQS
jgi:selenocysteine lyase/cysteine desulfurase